MKTTRFVAGVAFLGILGLAQAQQHHEDPAGGGAIHQIMKTPFVLPALQSELGLSAEQVAQLRQLKQEMLTKGKEISGQIAAQRQQLEGLLTVGTSKGALVERLYEQIGSLRGRQQFIGYETALKMKAKLTEPQRSKLAGMKLDELQQAMTTTDRMEMAQFLGGDNRATP
jgi:hypothetical protein